MTFEPTPKQVLALWNLIFTGQEPALSRLQPKLTPAERHPLEEAGLIRLEKRGRANHVLATEQAWAWAADNLTRPMSQSKLAAPVLAAVFKALDALLQPGKLTLAEFMAPAFEADPVPGAAPQLPEKIREAYLDASGGRTGVRVRLAEIFRRLPGVSREVLAEEMAAMQREGRFGLVLWPLDDPREISPADQRAAVHVAGVPRHIVYLEG